MTGTDDMDALLVAYADGELDEATAKIEAYLAVTPEARATLAIHQETAALLRAAFPASLFASPTLTLPPPARRRPFAARHGWAIAASLVMGIVGYGGGATWPGLIEPDHLMSDIAEYHAVFSRETVHLVEVPADQTAHLTAWLGKRVNRDLVIPDLKSAGLTFAGGRLVVADGAPVAELMYTRANGLPIAFCVLSRAGKKSGMKVERHGAISVAAWEDGSHAFVVVGEADTETVGGLAKLAQTQI